MSEVKKGKKRPKSYYIKCAKGKRPKRINDLDVGMKGFLITCNTHEKEAVRESYNILNEYADKLYGPEESLKKNENASDSESDSDDDVEKAMAKEASQIKDRAPAERRFQNVDCKAKNCIFIKTTLDSPTELAHAIFTDLEDTKVQKTRHAIRMLPITATCKAVMKNIEETAEKLFKPYFETEFGVGVKYTSVCKIRNNQNISRMAILPSLGRIIKEMNPLHTLCYDEPELVILIEVLRNICCLSVVKDFFRFRKYNLHEVVKTNENVASAATKDLCSKGKETEFEGTKANRNDDETTENEKSEKNENETHAALKSLCSKGNEVEETRASTNGNGTTKDEKSGQTENETNTNCETQICEFENYETENSKSENIGTKYSETKTCAIKGLGNEIETEDKSLEADSPMI